MSEKTSIKLRLQADMKDAMRAKEKERLAAIRFILAAIQRKEVDTRCELDDPQTLAVLEKIVKQHQDSIEQYKKAGRTELSEKEERELAIIESYMPKRLTESELDALIIEAIKSTGAASARDMGKVIAHVKTKAAGRADMRAVSEKVKKRLMN
jgi:uncharacterized protein YqeY